MIIIIIIFNHALIYYSLGIWREEKYMHIRGEWGRRTKSSSFIFLTSQWIISKTEKKKKRNSVILILFSAPEEIPLLGSGTRR